MAEERDTIIPPPTSPLAPDVPVTTPMTSSELDDGRTNLGALGPGPALAGSTRVAGAASSVGTATGAAANDDPEEIREQIERTREDMSHTLNELQERLSPQHIAQQARESVREATVGRVQHLMGTAGDRASVMAGRAQDAAGVAVEQVREHPIPVALAGAGAGLVWWLMRRSSSRRAWSNDDIYDWDDADMSYDRDYASLQFEDGTDSSRRAWASAPSQGWGRVLRDNPIPASIAAASIGYMLWNRRSGASNYETVGVRSSYAYDDTVGESLMDDGQYGASESGTRTTARVAESARDMSRQAREKASALGEQVGDSMRSAQARAGAVSRSVTRRLQSARTTTTTQFDRWLHDNPLAIGVAALAAGAVVGLTAPRTRREDELMGASRDALIERASDSAQHLKEQVREKVQHVASDLTGEQPQSQAPAESGAASMSGGSTSSV